ncbi:DUF2891 domain-containing protein [Avibacterium avium]|uniref:DUF2891 domain-containing protein n=1 Tax=Avibacterium avium TaxID=751 RepID=UPI003BF877D3
MKLTQQQATEFANMPLQFLRQEYPNHIMHLLNSEADVQSPRQLHPIFYGCFDWHSAVHGYWLLLRCVKIYPNLDSKAEIEKLFAEHFTAENVAHELAYFHAPFRASFERPYGYAWILALAQELKQSDLPQAEQWYELLQPLTLDIRQKLLDYLGKLSYPIRVGTHFNTAFALVLALDYARAMQDQELENAILQATERYYRQDKNYPANYEPAGDDYLSGALTEALLMSKVLADFPAWFAEFLPEQQLNTLLSPAEVSDRADPKIAHLDGLNLSRSWCFKHIAKALPADHALQTMLKNAIQEHLQASLDHVVGSHYSGAHWLATFALLALE